MTESEIQERTKTEAFRFVLRRASRADHEALDAHPAFAALMGGTLGIDGYRRLMEVFHGFYRMHDPILERACGRYGLDRLGFTYASRTMVLADDLEALGPSASRLGAYAASLPPIRSAGTLGGYLYVVEGSLLGGAVLSRAVDALLPGGQMAGNGYWLWCRDVGGARWAMTCAMLEELAQAETAREEMISGSQAAFSTFARWLDRWQDDAPSGGTRLEDARRC